MQTVAADEISALIRSCYKAMIDNDDEERSLQPGLIRIITCLLLTESQQLHLSSSRVALSSEVSFFTAQIISMTFQPQFLANQSTVFAHMTAQLTNQNSQFVDIFSAVDDTPLLES